MTYTILVVPYDKYSIIYPPNPILIIKGPVLTLRVQSQPSDAKAST